MEINWLGHAGFKIKAANKVIYIDPFQISTEEPADIIITTHEHFDHCNPEDLTKIAREHTVIVGNPQCEDNVKDIPKKSSTFLQPGDKTEIEGIKIEAVPAYNINKFREPGIPFHPKEDKKIGVIIEVENERLYHAGDTDFIDEMQELGDIDYAFIPVSGTYVMTAEEAASATEAINPKIVIPMHYGNIVGNEDDAEKFKAKIEKSGIEVRILQKTM
ncbi:MAG: MBL fold metallo-hydrolase [Candidatus Hodarchaeales archaeon]|jgi:L-ascorbate metabolism protein UlaG (beta-lactamase superfamily)